jgi:hypothetical protein
VAKALSGDRAVSRPEWIGSQGRAELLWSDHDDPSSGPSWVARLTSSPASGPRTGSEAIASSNEWGPVDPLLPVDLGQPSDRQVGPLGPEPLQQPDILGRYEGAQGHGARVPVARVGDGVALPVERTGDQDQAPMTRHGRPGDLGEPPRCHLGVGGDKSPIFAGT